MKLAETLNHVVNKLPGYLITKWASNIVYAQPSFSMLVEFIMHAAKVAKTLSTIRSYNDIKVKPYNNTHGKPKMIPVHSTQRHSRASSAAVVARQDISRMPVTSFKGRM